MRQDDRRNKEKLYLMHQMLKITIDRVQIFKESHGNFRPCVRKQNEDL